MSRKEIYLSALTAVCVATTGAPALAATGFYVGATAGQSFFHQNKSDYDAAVVDEFIVSSVSYHPASSSLDKHDIAFGALVGYRLAPAFSIEASYIDLGKLSYNSTGMLTDGRFFSANAVGNFTVGAKGPTLAALGIVPFSGRWEIYAKAGLFFARMTRSLYTNMDHSPAGPTPTNEGYSSVSSNSVDPLLGIGTSWQVLNRLTLRGEYTRFVNVGEKHKTGEMSVDVFNLGLTYSLGQP